MPDQRSDYRPVRRAVRRSRGRFRRTDTDPDAARGTARDAREPAPSPPRDGAPESEAAQTKMHDRVFTFIVTYKRTHDGNAPSLYQIARALGIDKSTVKYHLDRLVDAGHIRRTGRRGIEVIGGEWQLTDAAPDAPAGGEPSDADLSNSEPSGGDSDSDRRS